MNFSTAEKGGAWFEGEDTQAPDVLALDLGSVDDGEEYELFEIPAGVSEVVLNAGGNSVGVATFKLDFAPRVDASSAPTITITPSNGDNLQSQVINEYALEVVGLISVIIANSEYTAISSL